MNFVGNAQYAEVREGKENVAQFELIPWILGRCATVREARARLDALNLVGTPFSEHYPRRAAALAACRQGRGRRH